MIGAYDKLRMEYNSIYSIINSYTDGSITCYLNGLKEAIDSAKKEDIIYYLERIVNWYNDNISEIQSNEYVYDSHQREHASTKKFLEDILPDIKEYDFSNIEIINKKALIRDGEKKIFLSHRSSDKKYGDMLEKFIMGLGVKENQLIYTSHPLHKIPLGVKIYDYLRENINDQVFMIILWSNEYLQSPACLSEMGAAWVLQTDYIGIYTPDFDFGNPKYHEVPIDTTKMGAVLNGNENCKSSLLELKNKIVEFFGLVENEKRTMLLIDELVNSLK